MSRLDRAQVNGWKHSIRQLYADHRPVIDSIELATEDLIGADRNAVAILDDVHDDLLTAKRALNRAHARLTEAGWSNTASSGGAAA